MVYENEIKTIQNLLISINSVDENEIKMKLSIELFDFIQKTDDFIAIHPNLRVVTQKKLDEFKSINVVKRNKKLMSSIHKTIKFIDTLKLKKSYVLAINEDPIRIINIII
jgi:hypothetical protein